MGFLSTPFLFENIPWLDFSWSSGSSGEVGPAGISWKVSWGNLGGWRWCSSWMASGHCGLRKNSPIEGKVASLKLTASLPLKMDGWNTMEHSFPFEMAYFEGLLLLVSRSVVEIPLFTTGFSTRSGGWKNQQNVTNIHPLKQTASLAIKIGRAPKGKDRIPTIHFQVQTVSFREGNIYRT